MAGVIIAVLVVVAGLATTGFVTINKAWSCLFRQRGRDL